MASNFSQMNLNSNLTSPGASTPTLSIFPNSSTVSLSQVKTNNTSHGASSIVKEGAVRCKEDKLFASWSQRVLILREYQLEFFKVDSSKASLTIQLNTVIGVSRSEETKMAFEITRIANPKDINVRGTMMSRDVPTKTITCEVKNDDEIYDWIDKIYDRCPGMGGVSNPTNFNHRVHVGFDSQTGAFVGLPTEWERLLSNSAITKEDYKKNPQAVIEALEFYDNIKSREQTNQYYNMPPPPPKPSPSPYMPVGTGVAGPRPAPPTNRYPGGGSGTSSPISPPRPDQFGTDRPKELPDPEQRRRMDEEVRRVREIQRQREDEQYRREQEAYNASLPKTRVPIAQQELGGYGSLDDSHSRFNPSRPAPQAPSTRQPPRQYTAQRPAPPPPTTHGQPPVHRMAPDNHNPMRPPRQESPRVPPSPGPNKRPPQNNGVPQGPPPSRLPAPVQPVKPLNVNKQAQPKPAVPDGVRAAEAALTKKAAPEPRQKEVRMSSMTEAEVMERLKSVVSKHNPTESYSKQRKVGQGASGSVYVARIKENATSPVAREIYRNQGPRAQVAIKQMDLKSQPRKELIVNEIIVMKDSQHANIVNFLDSFLQEHNNELWVVMEFMEGGSLTDVIDNNSVIQEDQIATICYEVCFSALFLFVYVLTLYSPARDWHIFIAKQSFIVTSRAIMYC